MSNRQYTLQVSLLQETQKAVKLRWLDEEIEVDEEFWIPKSALDSDGLDREGSVQLLRKRMDTDDLTNIDVQTWWLLQQDWFDADLLKE